MAAAGLAAAFALARESAVHAAAAPVLTAAVSPSRLALGASASVTGTLSLEGTPGGAALELEASPYPYRGWSTIGRTVASPAGSFAFPVRPAENERLRVTASATGTRSEPLTLAVDPRVALAAVSIGPGQVRLSARIAHARGLASPPVAARWFVATRGSSTFHLAATTQTRELPGAVTYASAIVDPPSRRFAYRVCLNPGWEAAMGPPAVHGPCPHQGFRLPAAKPASRHRARAALEYGGEASGTPLPPFPSPAAIAAASSFLASRAGRTSFAVVDSAGRLAGLRTREHFESASVVKVMFLTAYLQMLQAHRRALGTRDRALLYPMIHESNNDSASAVLGIVGGGAVARVAREAGMRDYAPGVGWWAFTQTSAADQARFFAALGHLIPARYYGYAKYLMSTIEPEQSWGVPPVARPRWQVFFKTGALPSRGLFNEVARLERRGVSFDVAVFTDGDPSMAYGEQTIEGVAERLLRAAR